MCETLSTPSAESGLRENWTVSNMPAWQVPLFLAYNMFAILLVCLIRFTVNYKDLFSNLDGILITLSQYPGIKFSEFGEIFNVNPLAGMGNLFGLTSPYTDPTGAVLHLTGSAVLTYIMVAELLFIFIFPFARALGLSRALSALCGWVFVVLMTPVYQHMVVDISAFIHIVAFFFVGLSCVVSALFVHVGRQGPRMNIVCVLGFWAALLFYWMDYVFFIPASLPFLACFWAAIAITSETRTELIWKAVALVGLVLLFWALKLGAVFDTFATFNTRLNQLAGHVVWMAPVDREYLTSLLHDNFCFRHSRFCGATLLGWLGLAGLMCGVIFGSRRWRLIGVVGAGYMILLFAMSREFVQPHIIWPWAAPSYYEWAAYPVYLVAAIRFVTLVIQWERNLLEKAKLIPETFAGSVARFILSFKVPSELARVFLVPIVIVLVVVITSISVHSSKYFISLRDLRERLTRMPSNWPAPTSEAAQIARLLRVEVGRPFAGYFKSYDLQGSSALAQNIKIWQSDGATLDDFGQQLTLQQTGVEMAVEALTPQNTAPFLAALGVRYVSVKPGSALDAALRQTASPMEPAGLYSLARWNRGDYSPDHVLSVRDYSEFLKVIEDGHVDWTRTIVLDDKTANRIKGSLVPTENVAPMLVEKNGLHISAESAQRSILLIPRQFSNCYRWVSDTQDTRPVDVIRANFVMIGLIFEGRISGKLHFLYRWGRDQTCRAADAAQALSLGIGHGPTAQGHLGFFGRILLAQQERARVKTIELAKTFRPSNK